LFQEEAYEWIFPLIKECMEGCKITNELLNSHIEGKAELIFTPREEASTSVSISKIKKISEIKNMGLIEIEKEPIILKDGMNIFYGKNGSGKSTIYKALVNSLGEKHVKSESNIHNEDKSVSVKIVIDDLDGIERTVSYTGKEKFAIDIKVYDAKKMDFLVEPKREQFEIPILKQEIFNHIRDLFERYSNIFDNKIKEKGKRQIEIERTFDDGFDLFKKQTNEIEKILKENKFTEDDEKLLTIKKAEKGKLSVDKIELKKRALTTANNYIEDIVCKYGSIKDVDGKPIYEFKNIQSELEEYKKHQTEYKKLEKLIATNSIEGFKRYIDEIWIGNKKWKVFIISSLDFIESLDVEPDKCPYCHQSLSDDAKALLEKYKSLKSDAEREFRTYKKSIENVKKQFEIYRKNIKICSDLISKLIQLEGYKFNKQYTIGIIKEDIDVILSKMDNKEPITGAEIQFIEILKKQLEELFKIYQSNKDLIKFKIESIESVENDKKAIQKDIDELERRKRIKDKEDLIKEYLRIADIVCKFNTRKNDLIALKKKNSAAQTNFSKESYIKIYQEQITKEYKALEQEQLIKPSYKPKKEECICSIESTKGSFNISDVFSEGEIRIHSLAEFFAEATLTDYKGVYIFDDPVNSLDETNIDYVAQRILKLGNDGNQIIIFTHNILFLNELIEIEREYIIKVEKHRYGNKPEEVNIIIDSQKLNENAMKKRKERIQKIMKEIEELNAKPDLVEMRSKIAYMYSEMSGYLEDYFEKKILGGIITRHRNNIRMHSVKNLKDINKNGQLDILNELYGRTSRFCNRHAQTLSQKEADYKDIMVDYPKFKSLVGWEKN